jgi:hypothetical protein
LPGRAKIKDKVIGTLLGRSFCPTEKLSLWKVVLSHATSNYKENRGKGWVGL